MNIISGNTIPMILCGVFYSILCVFSIVTGLMYAQGRRKLNPLELSEKFVKSLDTDEKTDKFARKMGWVTFAVGIVQGMTALSILVFHNPVGWLIAVGFTAFSILSAGIKLKSRINAFPLMKIVFYIAIFIVMLTGGTRTIFF